MINDRIFSKIDFYDSSSRGNVEVGREIGSVGVSFEICSYARD